MLLQLQSHLVSAIWTVIFNDHHLEIVFAY
jgi:hypothetical protein